MASKTSVNKQRMVGLITVVSVSALLFAFSIVTTRINSQKSIAPNAPESKPQAAPRDRDLCKDITCGKNQECQNGKCVDISKNTPTPTKPGECKIGINTWTPGKACSNSNISSGLSSASYICYNSSEVLTVSAKTCTSDSALKAMAQKMCSDFPCKKITPTPTENKLPRFTNSQILGGVVGKTYYSDINAIDDDKGDKVSVTVEGLPAGLNFGPCSVPTGDNKISCSIQGTPKISGYYTIYATASDNRGGSTKAKFGLSIVNPTTPTPTPRY